MRQHLETKTIHAIDYSDFESFIKKTYGRNYCMVWTIECGNYTEHSYDTEPDDVEDIDDARKWLATGEGRSPWPGEILSVMVEDGHIDHGNYLIKVYW